MERGDGTYEWGKGMTRNEYPNGEWLAGPPADEEQRVVSRDTP